MSIKEAGMQFIGSIENEFVRIGADQMEMGQQLTERINGVADRVKTLDGKVTAMQVSIDELQAGQATIQTSITSMQQTQTEMMHILVAIQRKLDLN